MPGKPSLVQSLRMRNVPASSLTSPYDTRVISICRAIISLTAPRISSAVVSGRKRSDSANWNAWRAPLRRNCSSLRRNCVISSALCETQIRRRSVSKIGVLTTCQQRASTRSPTNAVYGCIVSVSGMPVRMTRASEATRLARAVFCVSPIPPGNAANKLVPSRSSRVTHAESRNALLTARIVASAVGDKMQRLTMEPSNTA